MIGLSRRYRSFLSHLFEGCSWDSIIVNEIEYIVTDRTGEGGAFAYLLSDVVNFIEEYGDGQVSYQDWCDELTPVVDRDVAIAVASELEWTLYYPGICQPILIGDY